MRWAGHAACRRQITNACSTLGRKTLVGIVGYRADMKRKTFRECMQHHSTATCQPYHHLRNIILFFTSLAGVFAHYAFTALPVLFQMYCSSFNPSHSCNDRPHYQLQGGFTLRRCLGPHEGSSEREGFGCGQMIKACLPSGSAQFERQFATFRGVKTVLLPHALSLHQLPTKCHISAFIV